MQIEQIKQQLSQVEQSIRQADQALQNEQQAPQELKDSVREMSAQSAKIQQARDEQSLRSTVEELDKSGMRAKKAVNSGNVSQQVKTAVTRASDQISQAKKQLH
jgi:alkyl hydroperoxide reductase subunit AhpF